MDKLRLKLQYKMQSIDWVSEDLGIPNKTDLAHVWDNIRQKINSVRTFY